MVPIVNQFLQRHHMSDSRFHPTFCERAERRGEWQVEGLGYLKIGLSASKAIYRRQAVSS